MKKYLLGLLAVPVMSPLLSIASADSVDGYTSDSDICVEVIDYETYSFGGSASDCGRDDYDGQCVYSYFDLPSDILPVYVENGRYCDGGSSEPYLVSSMPFSLRQVMRDDSISLYESYTNSEDYTNKYVSSGKIYYSLSPITYNPNSGGGSSDSDSVFPEITVPGSFTSGLTQLVENFGGTIANWIPSVLLIALGITAIFALFRVVRGYAKSAFKG